MITNHNFSQMIDEIIEKNLISIPEFGNQYIASVPAIENLPEFDWIRKIFSADYQFNLVRELVTTKQLQL